MNEIQLPAVPWYRRDVLGSLRAAAETIKVCIISPKSNFQISGFAKVGRQFFWTTFTTYAILPLLIMHVICVLGKALYPSAFDLMDFNLATNIQVLPLHYLFAFAVVWLLGQLVYVSLRIVGATNSNNKNAIIELTWYIGTSVLCFLYWLLVVGFFFTVFSLLDHSISNAIDKYSPFLIAIVMLLLLRSLISSIHVNLTSSILKVTIGVLLGSSFLLAIPIFMIVWSFGN